MLNKSAQLPFTVPETGQRTDKYFTTLKFEFSTIMNIFDNKHYHAYLMTAFTDILVIGDYQRIRVLFEEGNNDDDKNWLVDAIKAFCTHTKLDMAKYLALKFPFIKYTTSLQSIYDPITCTQRVVQIRHFESTKGQNLQPSSSCVRHAQQ